MHKQLLKGILILFISNYIKADVKELKLQEREYLPPKEKVTVQKIIPNGFIAYLPPVEKPEDRDLHSNEREYLPPSKTKPNKGYLPPEHGNYNLESNKEKLGYRYNKPQVIDDPLPMKINYVQPLALDFLSGQYKPTFKGGLIPAIFVNDNNIPLLNGNNFKDTSLNNITKMNVKILNPSRLHTKVDYTLKSTNSDITQAENTIQTNKYIKNPTKDEDVVPINRYEEKQMIYLLFNYDDDTELSASAPVVIYRPGDDLSFTEDTTIIDDYEHMFPKENKSENKTSAITNTTTTTTSTTTTTPTPPLVHHITDDSQSIEVNKHQSSSSEESESNHSGGGGGYFYEKPKIPFTF